MDRPTENHASNSVTVLLRSNVLLVAMKMKSTSCCIATDIVDCRSCGKLPQTYCRADRTAKRSVQQSFYCLPRYLLCSVAIATGSGKRNTEPQLKCMRRTEKYTSTGHIEMRGRIDSFRTEPPYWTNLNSSVAWVREQTIPNKRPQLVGEDSVNVCR
jgi:hypothetical protein